MFGALSAHSLDQVFDRCPAFKNVEIGFVLLEQVQVGHQNSGGHPQLRATHFNILELDELVGIVDVLLVLLERGLASF